MSSWSSSGGWTTTTATGRRAPGCSGSPTGWWATTWAGPTRRAEIPADLTEASAPDPRAASLERQVARDLLLRALAAVDLDHRAVLILHDLEERAAPEVAAALGIRSTRLLAPAQWTAEGGGGRAPLARGGVR
jgi:hypothetical protein